MQFSEISSPFAIYEEGSSYVVPNVLLATAKVVLARLEKEPVEVVLKSLWETGRKTLSSRSTSQDAEKVWEFFLYQYLSQPHGEMPFTAIRIEMMEQMLSGPPEAGWIALKNRLLANIDDVSGWSSSIQKELNEMHQIWREEDGNYYEKDSDGTVYRVIGAKTLEETRLDFLTEQIGRAFGTIHVFLQFFSLLAISADFVQHQDAYHISMKAMLQERRWPSLNYRWSHLQWIPVRSVIWRPWSNLCDPRWLAGDLLATITDTLKMQPFEPAHIPTGAESQLSTDYDRQADFVLETQLRVGEEEAIVLKYGGREFRWVNASLESETRVSVGLKPGDDPLKAEEELNRFLSLLVWEHQFPVSKKDGPVVGRRRDLPYMVATRSIFSLNVDPRQPLRMNVGAIGAKENLVLSMFREAINARSVFYAFLSYWKVIEVVFKKKDQRFAWVDTTAAQLSQEQGRIRDILSGHPRLAVYLDDNCRSAVVHVFKPPFVDPDSSEDSVRLRLDLPIVKALAKIAMETLPAFK